MSVSIPQFGFQKEPLDVELAHYFTVVHKSRSNRGTNNARDEKHSQHDLCTDINFLPYMQNLNQKSTHQESCSKP